MSNATLASGQGCKADSVWGAILFLELRSMPPLSIPGAGSP
jgi:hypothetical protein